MPTFFSYYHLEGEMWNYLTLTVNIQIREDQVTKNYPGAMKRNTKYGKT